MTDLRAVRNRGVIALVLVAVTAIWFLRLAFRLTGAALVLIAAAVAILIGLGWIGGRLRDQRSR